VSTDPRAQQFLTALRAGNARAAEDIVRSYLADGMAPGVVHVEVIAPAMHAIGALWARDELSVAEEHLATAITYRVLNVISAAGARAATTRERVMLAALEDERHVMGLQMVADTLESAGFAVQLLGADVPLDSLAAAVARFAPAVLGLSSTMPAGPRLEATIRRLQRVDPALPVLIGGGGVPTMLRERPAPRYVRSADLAVRAIEDALGTAAAA
jgi:MerR family transcriptional regulator, light-induced transcriptional regulator